MWNPLRARQPESANVPARAPTSFVPVATRHELAALLAEPGPVALFLHDPWCPISRRAKGELNALGTDLPTIDVSRQHDLSNEVERRTGVRHESPQLFVLTGGRTTWHASHGRITAAALDEALRAPVEGGQG